MGHHSKKSKGIPTSPSPDPNPLGQIFNGFDINTMSNMLSSIDINQIASILSNDNISSNNTNSTNESPNNTTTEGEKPLSIPDILQEFQKEALPKGTNYNPELPPNDPIVIVLNSIKPLLPPDKIEIVDSFIKLLGIKMVIDSIFPVQSQSKHKVEVKEEIIPTEEDIIE